jgi:hypothetical protein
MDASGEVRRQQAQERMMRVPLCLVLHLCAGSTALASAPLGGAFLYAGGPSGGDRGFTAANIDAYLGELQDSLGMNTVIIHSLQYEATGCGSNVFQWQPRMNPALQGNMLSALFQSAQNRGMNVYVGLVSSSELCADYFSQPNEADVAAQTFALAQQIYQTFSGYSSFKGWYIPDEPGLCAGPNVNCDDPLSVYYRDMVNYIHWATCDYSKEILASPSLNGAPEQGLTPATMASRAHWLQQCSGLDIQVWQDSVGADSINLDRDAGGSTVEDYFTAIRDQIGRAGLWSDNELFTSWDPQNTCQFNMSSLCYRPASLMRLNQQLWQTRSDSTTPITSLRVTWLNQMHMTGDSASPDPNVYPEHKRMYNMYRAVYGLKQASYLTPVSYSWDTAPAANYPDTNPPSKLTDTLPGNPRIYNDGHWVGVLGTANARFDLGSIKKVHWVGAQLMRKAAYGIQIPTSMTVWCSTDNVSWTNLGNFPAPTDTPPPSDLEYYLGNNTRFNDPVCRWVSVWLNNGGNWTFVSEVEIAQEYP